MQKMNSDLFNDKNLNEAKLDGEAGNYRWTYYYGETEHRWELDRIEMTVDELPNQ